MIPLRLALTNFLAYKNPAPLDFTGLHVAVLVGENGAGKSSLLDAITWAVWGRARAKRDEELVHQGQSEMRVEFTFALGPQTYRIVRAKRVGRGSSTILDLQAADAAGRWVSVGEATIPQTQKKIEQLLRLSYETFVNSAYLMQGKADEFTGKPPAKRKEVLADILGLQQWEAYEARAKEKIREIEKRLAGLDAVLEEIEAELGRRDEYERELTEAQALVIAVGERLRQAEAGWAQIDAARQALIALERQLDDLARRIREAENEIAALDADLGQAQARADAASLSRELEAAQQRLAALEALEAERERAAEARQRAGEVAAELRGQNETARAEADVLKKRVEALQAATEPRCPTCGQPLAEAARAQLVDELNAEVEARRERYRANQAHLKGLNDEQAALDQSLAQMTADLREKPALIRQVADLQAALERAGEAQERIAALTGRRARWAASLEADRAQHDRLEAEASQHEAVLRDAAAKQAALDALRQEDTLAKARLGAAQQKLAALEEQARQRDAKRAERNQLAEEQGLHEELREAFGRRGVPALMIEAAVPEIEASANALLARMTGGRMHVRFNTQRETLAGEVRETLDIQISDELGTRAYESFSIDGCEPVCIRRNGQIVYVPIQRLWREQAPSCKTSAGYELQPADYESLCYQDGRAVWLPVESLLRHPAPPEMLRVTLSPGNYSITLTPHHSVFVMTPDGLVVKRGEEVRPGDWMLSPRRIPEGQPQTCLDMVDWISPEFLMRRKTVNKALRWNEQTIWSRRDQSLNRFVLNDAELGEFLGLAVAEASGRDTLSFAVGSDGGLAERVIDLSHRLFGVSRTSLGEVPADALARYVARAPGVSSRTPQAQFRPVVGGRLLAHMVGNLIGHGAQNKHVPAPVFNASNETKLAFLRALIAGDGYLRVRPERNHAEIGVTTTSPRLAADTILLCRQLGMWACLGKHDDAGFRRQMNHRLSYRVSIAGQMNVERLFDGVRVARHPHPGIFDGIPLELVKITRHNRQRRLKRVSSDERFECGARVVPLRSRVDYERMLCWLQDWAVLEVASVEKVSPASPYVYDLVVPDNHSFVAGTGLILVHNSGGEQFRVNFAIRVALSQLLARRAGTQLQTLIIDEGFGVLDAAGRERLVEAIHAAQQDFQRILVVTHIDELKDAFPARIEISKGPEGSDITVV